jgi:hypothetical protein
MLCHGSTSCMPPYLAYMTNISPLIPLNKKIIDIKINISPEILLNQFLRLIVVYSICYIVSISNRGHAVSFLNLEILLMDYSISGKGVSFCMSPSVLLIMKDTSHEVKKKMLLNSDFLATYMSLDRRKGRERPSGIGYRVAYFWVNGHSP